MVQTELNVDKVMTIFKKSDIAEIMDKLGLNKLSKVTLENLRQILESANIVMSSKEI
jgi:predicted double-glycine peptidase